MVDVKIGTSRRRALRVAMFTERTRKNGSSRVVCYQFGGHLRQANIDVRFFPPSSIALYEFFYERFKQPGWLVIGLKVIYWYLVVLPNRLVQILQSPGYNIVFVQRGLLKWDSSPVLEILLWTLTKRVFKHRFVYALDDAMYLLAPRQYQARIKLADWVYTGAPDIMQYARTFNPNLMVIESVVDLEYYRPKRHSEHQPIVIGWAGTILDNHGGPLRTIASALSRVSKLYQVVIHIVSNTSWQPDDLGIGVINIPWSLTHEVEHLSQFDIGIMPVEDSLYGRAKEGYKLKTYMAMGLPVVCSPVGKNKEIVQEGVTGFFATSEDEWVDKLSKLITSCALRAQIGAAGRDRVNERYSLSKAGPELAKWLWSVYSGREILPEQ